MDSRLFYALSFCLLPGTLAWHDLRYTHLAMRSKVLSMLALSGSALLFATTAWGAPGKTSKPHPTPVTSAAAASSSAAAAPSGSSYAKAPADGSKGPSAGESKKAAKTTPEEDPIERARQGVVTIERDGDILGLGTVLKNDGRILTALSPLGNGNSLTLRYPDGSTVPAKVGYSERLWDLALVVPQMGRWSQGLSASEEDPLSVGGALRAFAPGKTLPQVATIVMKDRRSLLGADDQLLRDVLEVNTKIGPKEFGSPVIDQKGNVVAVLAHACLPVEKGPCAPTAFGVPIDAARSFLRNAPPNAVPPAPWLGIQGVSDATSVAKGVRVTSVSPDSPADEAGLRGGPDKKGDVILAVDGVPVTSPDALAQAMHTKSVGDRLHLLLLSDGKYKDSVIILQPAPSQEKP